MRIYIKAALIAIGVVGSFFGTLFCIAASVKALGGDVGHFYLTVSAVLGGGAVFLLAVSILKDRERA